MAPKRKTAQQRWGYEFARAREAAGFTSQVQFANHPDVHVSASLIAHWETGRAMPKLKDLEDCEKVLGTNGYLKRLLLDWVSLEVSPEWLEWLDVEEHATELLTHENMLIPGLLQTPAYAQTILPPELVEQRLERQQIFETGSPPFYEVLLDESILYRKVGTPDIMAGALAHLVEMSTRDDIIVRIVPFSVNVTRFAYPFVLATVESGKQAAYIQGALRGRILERPDEIAELRRVWGRYGALALPEHESIDLIRQMIKERWSTP
jgi:transcriptional regulator with XRE-family HTH domain